MRSIRWGRVLLGGFLVELALAVIVLPLYPLAGQQSLLYAAPPASFLASLALGFWVAGKVAQQRVLHGALVGVAATLMFVGLTLGAPEPVAYIVAHLLKIFGGAAGGYVAAKRASGRQASV